MNTHNAITRHPKAGGKEKGRVEDERDIKNEWNGNAAPGKDAWKATKLKAGLRSPRDGQSKGA